MGWRREIRDRIAELEQRRLWLEDARLRARMLGCPEGERMEEEAKVELQELNQQINDLRASLE